MCADFMRRIMIHNMFNAIRCLLLLLLPWYNKQQYKTHKSICVISMLTWNCEMAIKAWSSSSKKNPRAIQFVRFVRFPHFCSIIAESRPSWSNLRNKLLEKKRIRKSIEKIYSEHTKAERETVIEDWFNSRFIFILDIDCCLFVCM